MAETKIVHGVYSNHDKVMEHSSPTVAVGNWVAQFSYTFHNFFHPYVGELLTKLNRDSLPGMLDATWQNSLKWDSLNLDRDTPPDSFDALWTESMDAQSAQWNYFKGRYNPTDTYLADVVYSPKEIDVAEDRPYANYNWELFFHIPLTIAIHLSKTQRFAEAQRWFHYIFDPTCSDTTIDVPTRFWKFLAFRRPNTEKTIDNIVRILSIPREELEGAELALQDEYMNGYSAILDHPFQPHRVARTRPLAYQYNVVMKYLDNLIAWGDNLFQQDTLESINEATQLYVLAANILGERPQKIPPRGKVQGFTFHQLKEKGLGPIGDGIVELEVAFPLSVATLTSGASAESGAEESSALFGIGRTLYFCLPRNEKLLSYWDTVADRLFKIRHCMNIAGVVRPLALFDPPLDPAMLVKAVAGGIDISSLVNGLNQPIGPVRSLALIQKALELCGEVRSLGGALLSALEKGDAEHLTLIRQRHEIQVQQMAQEVRFLQWKAAQEATKSLLTSRATALERFHFYQRLLGLAANQNAPVDLPIDARELTEENFGEAYAALVGQYDKKLTLPKYPDLKIAGDTSPSQQSGASGAGRLSLNRNENAELNEHAPAARSMRSRAMETDTISAALSMVPDVGVDFHWWGLGGRMVVFGGSLMASQGRFTSSLMNFSAAIDEGEGASATKTAGYERRSDDWLLQYNLAGHELMQIGRQILTSLIAEQIAHHEYVNVRRQIANAQEVGQFLQDKFTNKDLYLWMQGETSRLYYEYYRFAFDIARKAERTMKQELMRPELDARDFVKFNYWDGGRKGLLSGEALHLDVKRMEMAYHDNNLRELELTRHVSLRQLNPLALLSFKTTGSCTFNIPEWFFDRDCPGHYMRRIKSVALSIPCVAGPYTSINCTLSLLKSSVRKSPVASEEYARSEGEDDARFVEYIGAIQSIVTSSSSNDSGLFETNLRDERFLPCEGAGAISTWKLDMAAEYAAFDFATISDVILHIRYTARQGVEPGKVNEALRDLFEQADKSNLALLFSLRHDFPTEWAAFLNSTEDFKATIRKEYFPYFTQGKTIMISSLQVYGANGMNPPKHHALGAAIEAANTGMSDKNKQAFEITAAADPAGPTQALTRNAKAEVFLVVRYTLE